MPERGRRGALARGREWLAAQPLWVQLLAASLVYWGLVGLAALVESLLGARPLLEQWQPFVAVWLGLLIGLWYSGRASRRREK